MVVQEDIKELVDISIKSTSLSLPSYKDNGLMINFRDGLCQTLYFSGCEPSLPFAQSEIFQACISTSRRLTAESSDCKNVYEVTFDIKGSNFKFEPGDTIGIIPKNEESEVTFILKHLELLSQAEQCYEITIDKCVKGAKIPPHIPEKSTLGHVLRHCVDIRSVVKKMFLLALSRHTTDAVERKVLEYLCSKEGSAMYTKYILNGHISVVDIFNIFKTCKPPICTLLANLPKLLPRPYSIVNCQKKKENVLRICFSVTELNDNRKGLTTGFLEKIILKDRIENKLNNLCLTAEKCHREEKVSIYLRKNMNGFLRHENIADPVLLVGSGTGVAPFIGFLEKRDVIRQQNPSLMLGNSWLFFGCRNPKLDHLYEEELKQFSLSGSLNRLDTAFSRDVSKDVKHVQDAIIQNAQDVSNFIKNGAVVYVCGDQKTMAVEVREAFKLCLQLHDGQTEEMSEKYISDLEKSKRYVIDIWN